MPPRKSCIGLIDPHAWKIPAREGGIPPFGEPSRLIFTLNQDTPNEPKPTLTPEPAGLKKFDEYRAHPPKLVRNPAEAAREPGPRRES